MKSDHDECNPADLAVATRAGDEGQIPALPPGVLIGSIRRVWFDGGRENGACAAPLGQPGNSGIELETKPGRYVHFVRAGNAIGLVSGAMPAPDANAKRCWCDLTDPLAAAFDGRPGINRIIGTGATAETPVSSSGIERRSANEGMVATAWQLTLSTGPALVCRLADGQVTMTCESADGGVTAVGQIGILG